jgi:predicted PP-loop superfamily ATPase
MVTILAWSGGKDSTATGILAKKHNIKIDHIVIVMPDPFKQFKEAKYLLGIATGEDRKILEPNESLLIKFGYTEEMAKELCEEHGLLNPLYKHFKRLGCVRCPKQGIKALKKVKELEPEKFQWLIDHDEESPVKFKPNKTFKEILKKVNEE